tara:strand:+ start:250 stop:666 length:417 start_codon:yes stop_codon:yes gene_type:complete
MPKLLLKESEIEDLILFYLNSLRDAFFWKNPAGGFFDGKKIRKHASKFIIKGGSDIIGLYKGHFFAFEVKTPVSIKFYEKHRDRLEKTASWALKTDRERHFRRQIEFQKKIKQNGGNASFVSSIEDVKKCLQIELNNV